MITGMRQLTGLLLLVSGVALWRMPHPVDLGTWLLGCSLYGFFTVGVWRERRQETRHGRRRQPGEHVDPV